ncbi:hypothetical protein BDK51DRAFT_30954 [Blyttiomyces helicus]|uniref:Uncharacterized protein n=1 Tax=Blyttiomyces helicus TaxID=388810 RepID=A0A4P9WEG9_9FUNG|nr:hypothetical protein BDK51DRAFT_30954 [Blyttiomyces helicus]|eukprot:RKO90792.1 hypothetical protein BDK51DRAFT_30954 [Blyttiomyces helicus]
MLETMLLGAYSSRLGFGHAGLCRWTRKELPAGGRPTRGGMACEAVLDEKGKEDVDGCGPIRATHGVLQHSENCNELLFRSAPLRPHKSIVEAATQELRVGIPASCIMAQYLMASVVRVKEGTDTANRKLPRHIGNVRFWSTKDDMATIWRGLQEEILSIDFNLSGEQNIRNFLTHMLNDGNANVRDAVFHYLPKTATSDRFEPGIASPSMLEAVWCYGHGKLILIDGTFGMCLQKILLFVVMVITFLIEP